MTNKGNYNSKYRDVDNYMQTERIQGSSYADGPFYRRASSSRDHQDAVICMDEVSYLVEQRHVATQINAGEDDGAVEVISTTYAKAFKCYAFDSWKTSTRRSGMANKGNHNPKYRHVHKKMQTERIQGSCTADGPCHRTASLSRAHQHAEISTAKVSYLVQQRHVATQINAGEDGGDVEVVSIAYAKSLKCHARDSWKTNNRCGGMNLGKSVNHQGYTHVHAYIQTG